MAEQSRQRGKGAQCPQHWGGHPCLNTSGTWKPPSIFIINFSLLDENAHFKKKSGQLKAFDFQIKDLLWIEVLNAVEQGIGIIAKGSD